MKINVELEHPDIAKAPEGTLSTLTDALQRIAVASLDAGAKSASQETGGNMAQTASERQDETKTAKTDTTTAPVKKSSESASVKATTPKAETTAPVKEAKKETKTAASEAKSEPASGEGEGSDAEPLDREAVLTLAKKVTTSGKAKEVKELIKGFGIEKLSALPDENLAEFAEKLKAL